jgi:membrane fusion protein, multidrug efflux system
MQFPYRAPAANTGAGARLSARRPTAALICIFALAGLLAACDGQGAPKEASRPTPEAARPAFVVRATAVAATDRTTSAFSASPSA